MRLTIFTPTYNREKLLERLYNSLLVQSNKDFEWLIIDDGSTDLTYKLVQEWEKERKINIKYIYKKNEGKYKAYNLAIKISTSELFFCVDSDDYLTSKSVESILVFWDKNKTNNISGIIGMKENLKGNLLGDKFDVNLELSSLFKLNNKYKCKGEYSLVYDLNILKKYEFPEIQSEKFITESVLYDQIDKDYEMILLNKTLTICEYQSSGYSSNLIDIIWKNPIGFKIYYCQRIDMNVNFIDRVVYILKYHIFNIISKEQIYFYNGKYKNLVKILKPMGYLSYILYLMKKRIIYEK